ncbi:hypothetical protein C8A00DRAFT_35147 [Chaetomidium leptoderma]|uniref:Uncharacterized protein n=1 Tax=Chaetomidium leptoderma TaxID=669021 RepID=A0AAN6VII5_9PEZI|nr:hypothetical protein C8A00DRAFT_35147 [Chaetomidium leptoderma]
MSESVQNREMALSGTEGSYDIYHGDAQVCHVYWCAPYLSGKKAIEISSVNGDYKVEDPMVDLANKRSQVSQDEGPQEDQYAPRPYEEY